MENRKQQQGKFVRCIFIASKLQLIHVIQKQKRDNSYIGFMIGIDDMCHFTSRDMGYYPFYFHGYRVPCSILFFTFRDRYGIFRKLIRGIFAKFYGILGRLLKGILDIIDSFYTSLRSMRSMSSNSTMGIRGSFTNMLKNDPIKN